MRTQYVRMLYCLILDNFATPTYEPLGNKGSELNKFIFIRVALTNLFYKTGALGRALLIT
jgi:hypothetical protein